jgi:hypothetical protein
LKQHCKQKKDEEGVVESNRNERHRERPKQIKPSITGGETKKFNLANSSMFPFLVSHWPLLSVPLSHSSSCLLATSIVYPDPI